MINMPTLPHMDGGVKNLRGSRWDRQQGVSDRITSREALYFGLLPLYTFWVSGVQSFHTSPEWLNVNLFVQFPLPPCFVCFCFCDITCVMAASIYDLIPILSQTGFPVYFCAWLLRRLVHGSYSFEYVINFENDALNFLENSVWRSWTLDL